MRGIATIGRSTPAAGVLGGQSLRYLSDTFTRDNGAIGNGWIGPTWTIASNQAKNTPALSAEIITNGTFDADANWPKSAGWTISGGVLHCAATAAQYSSARQDGVLTVGHWYLLSFEVSNLTVGNVWVEEDASANINTVAANGNYSRVFCAAAGGALRFKASVTNMTADIDNVSLKEISLTSMFTVRRMTAQETASVEVRDFPGVGANYTYPLGVVCNLDNPSNPQNFVLGYHNNTSAKLVKCVNGAYTTLVNVTLTTACGNVLVLKNGDTYTLFYDYQQVGNPQTIAGMTGQYFGLLSTISSVALDNFVASPKTALKPLTVIGDSIATFDSGRQVWPFKLARSYNQGANKVANHAKGGMGVLVGATNMAAQVTAAATDNADIILVALGTNDTTEVGVQAAYTNNINTIKGTNPNAAIYALNILPCSSGPAFGAGKIAAINAAITAACTATGVTLWDTTGWINPATDCSDGLHPTDAGQAKIVAQILARLP